MEMGAFGFWIFVAAIIVGSMWSETRKKAEKHETLRRIVEKTGTIDEAKWRELFEEDSAAERTRALRIAPAHRRTVIMFAGAGMATFFLIPPWRGTYRAVVLAAWPIGAGLAGVGAGHVVSSRFASGRAGPGTNPRLPRWRAASRSADLQKAHRYLVSPWRARGMTAPSPRWCGRRTCAYASSCTTCAAHGAWHDLARRSFSRPGVHRTTAQRHGFRRRLKRIMVNVWRRKCGAASSPPSAM